MKKFIYAMVLTMTALTLMLSGAYANSAADNRETQKKEIETLMNDYLRLWNAHDAATIIERVYRLEANNPWATKEGLQAEFDRLRAAGYDHSDISSVVGCVIAPDMGQAELRFVRLKTDGTFMPPKDRISLYSLKRFADGWRVTGMKALPPNQKMECPSK